MKLPWKQLGLLLLLLAVGVRLTGGSHGRSSGFAARPPELFQYSEVPQPSAAPWVVNTARWLGRWPVGNAWLVRDVAFDQRWPSFAVGVAAAVTSPASWPRVWQEAELRTIRAMSWTHVTTQQLLAASRHAAATRGRTPVFLRWRLEPVVMTGGRAAGLVSLVGRGVLAGLPIVTSLPLTWH